MDNLDVTKTPCITNLLTDFLHCTSLNYVSVVTGSANLASLRRAVSELWRGEKVGAFFSPQQVAGYAQSEPGNIKDNDLTIRLKNVAFS